MPEVRVNVLQHSQTGKVHIVQLELSNLRHCYCSLNRRREPDERTIELSEDEVCETCVKGFLDDCSEDSIEEMLVDTADVTQLRESFSD